MALQFALHALGGGLRLSPCQPVQQQRGPAAGLFAKRGRRRPCAAVPQAAAAAVTAAPAAPAALPRALRDATAVLTAASGATVYVLGVSHVSKESCRQIEELIRLAKPDIVLVELCKERVPLLVNPDDPPPNIWYSARPATAITGLPTGPGWASAEQLAALLRCRGGAPVTAAEIEDDAAALLATGLFASAKPAVQPPRPDAAPAFVVQSGGLQTVAPVGEIGFTVRERSLPKLASLEVQLEVGDAAALAEPAAAAVAAAVQQAAAGASAVGCYLQARQALLALFPETERAGLEVVFQGVESGKATAVVRRVPAGQAPSLTGLEASAAGGKGWGIEPLQRRAKQSAQSVRIGASMQIDAAALAEAASSSGASAASAAGGATAAGVQLRLWTEAERRQGEAGASGQAAAASGLSAAFAQTITQAYARSQAQAGRRVGVPPGAAWQAALQAAVASGAQQVLLGDRPAGTTAQRLADGIWAKCSPFLLGSIPAAIASAVIVSSSLDAGPLTPLAAGAAAVLPVAAAAWPIVAPLREISQLAGMSAVQIEEAVRVKEPVQAASADAPVIKLWGEDALLDWPGAMGPVVDERDAFMARTLAAAANGEARGLCPAYVVTKGDGGRAVLRYAMPEGGAPGVCPPGTGDGVYAPLPAGRTVVGVVGTAHVRGIIRAWQQAQADPDLSKFV